MVWPPYSPDLNPIENSWALMKAIIYERHPELEKAPDTVMKKYLSIEAAKEAWHAISTLAWPDVPENVCQKPIHHDSHISYSLVY